MINPTVNTANERFTIELPRLWTDVIIAHLTVSNRALPAQLLQAATTCCYIGYSYIHVVCWLGAGKAMHVPTLDSLQHATQVRCQYVQKAVARSLSDLV